MAYEITKQNLEEMTLLLLFLTSWEERIVSSHPPIRRAWKGYDFGILNALEEQELISGSRRAKSTYLTDEGVKRAEKLLERYKNFLQTSEEIPIIAQELDDEAIINPKDFVVDLKARSQEQDSAMLPSRCVVTFSYLGELIEWVKETKKPEELSWFSAKHPALKFSGGETELCIVVLPGVGAAYHAHFLEELIELGVRTCVLFGGAGVLKDDIPRGDALIPSRAIREEGASYHYLPPSTYAEASKELTQRLVDGFREKSIPLHVGDTWTTDGIYRETKKKIARYRDAGVLSVEMEAAAHFAVAKFRGIEAAAVFYAGDYIGGDVWDRRKDVEHSVSKEEILETILSVLSG